MKHLMFLAHSLASRVWLVHSAADSRCCSKESQAASNWAVSVSNVCCSTAIASCRLWTSSIKPCNIQGITPLQIEVWLSTRINNIDSRQTLSKIIFYEYPKSYLKSSSRYENCTEIKITFNFLYRYLKRYILHSI